MTTIAGTLKPKHVDLSMGPVTVEAATLHVAALLKTDPRILDWTQFYHGVRSRVPCIAETQDFEILIPHARTESVNDMVMGAGRMKTAAGDAGRVRYVFVIGVPQRLAADYLRVIGAIARILRDPAAERELRAIATAEDFVSALSRREKSLA